MAVIIDLIGSMIVRASIIAIILNLMVNLHESLYKYTQRNYLNETLNAAVQTISADVRLAGYNSTNKRFPTAKINDVRFRADIDDNSVNGVEIIRFYDSTVSGARRLYRQVNGGTPMLVAVSVDSFAVRYFLVNGSAPSGTSNVNNIKSVHFVLRLASTATEYAYKYTGKTDSIPARVLWQQHFFPENQ